MTKEMVPANPEDVLQALDRIGQSIEVWKIAVQRARDSGTSSISIAKGPFPPISVPGPPPPFSGCGLELELDHPPLDGCEEFDIDVYVQQVSGVFLGIYHGLVYDQGGVSSP
jgi:hypothetical protein